MTHMLDPQHITMTTLVGNNFLDTTGMRGWNKRFEYRHNARDFGLFTHPTKGVNVANVIAVDYYPLDFAAPNSAAATYEKNANILDTIRY